MSADGHKQDGRQARWDRHNLLRRQVIIDAAIALLVVLQAGIALLVLFRTVALLGSALRTRTALRADKRLGAFGGNSWR